jgi:tRNA threonylcarbamoyladenosine biosynthesis protein TsaB
MQQPRILCIETSGRIGSIAVAEGPRCLEVRTFRTDVGHATDLLPQLAELARGQDWAPEAVDQVYLSIGPGSFTGLRIAATVSRTLAWSTGARVVAVPTLAVIAHNALAVVPAPRQLGVVLDAKRGQVYCAAFELRDARYWQITEPGVRDPAGFCESLEPPRTLLGEGIPHHSQALSAVEYEPLPEALCRPRVEWVHTLGWDLAQRGLFTDPRRLTPLYLRIPEAEEVWQRKHGVP